MKPRASSSPDVGERVRAMPLVGSLLRLLEEQWTGTLTAESPSGECAAVVRIEAGFATAGRVNGATGSLMQCLVPLCSRVDLCIALADGVDLVEAGPDVATGPVDVPRLMAIAMRGPVRQDIVDAAIDALGSDLLKLSPQTDLDRYGFEPRERKAVAWLAREPGSLDDIRKRAELPEPQLRRLLYVLLATRGATHLASWRRITSGALQHAPPYARPRAPARNDEPTRVAPHSPAVTERAAGRNPSPARVQPPNRTLTYWPPDWRAPRSGRYHSQRPEHHTTEVKPPSPHANGVPVSVAPHAEPLPQLDADAHFRVAEVLLSRGRPSAAVLEAQKGMKLRAPTPDQRALYAWALYQRSARPTPVHPHVFLHLDEALSADANCARAHYIKGLLLVRIGQHQDEAKAHLLRALQLDPSNQDAERALRLLQAQKSRP